MNAVQLIFDLLLDECLQELKARATEVMPVAPDKDTRDRIERDRYLYFGPSEDPEPFASVKLTESEKRLPGNLRGKRVPKAEKARRQRHSMREQLLPQLRARWLSDRNAELERLMRFRWFRYKKAAMKVKFNRGDFPPELVDYIAKHWKAMSIHEKVLSYLELRETEQHQRWNSVPDYDPEYWLEEPQFNDRERMIATMMEHHLDEINRVRELASRAAAAQDWETWGNLKQDLEALDAQYFTLEERAEPNSRMVMPHVDYWDPQYTAPPKEIQQTPRDLFSAFAELVA
jgi:hypothetical protein